MLTARADDYAPITPRGAAMYRLLDLYTDEDRYVARLGKTRYDAVCDRLYAYTEPDCCAEHPAGCGTAVH